MPFRDAEQHLRDILESINNIDTFLGDMDFDGYRGDQKTKSAVERQMQIITRLRFAWEMMGIAFVLALIGRASAVWGIYCGTGTTELTTRSLGTR